MSGGSRLSPLQKRILLQLSDVQPAWTLVGGAALAAIHLKHRGTRDIELFWRKDVDLKLVLREIKERLEQNDLRIETLQQAKGFVRLKISNTGETVIADLVIDTTPVVREDEKVLLEDVQILVAARYEILVNKLCALLDRSEIRDLLDVKMLLESGENLEEALREPSLEDGGFSALTLAWVLDTMDVQRLAMAVGFSENETIELCRFKENFVQRILAAAKAVQTRSVFTLM